MKFDQFISYYKANILNMVVFFEKTIYLLKFYSVIRADRFSAEAPPSPPCTASPSPPCCPCIPSCDGESLGPTPDERKII